MAGGFLGNAGRDALRQAVKTLESGSAAELVIAIRPRSGSYLHAAVAAGTTAAAIALAFLLYSDVSFELWSFVIDPLAAGFLVGLIASRIAPLCRWLTPRPRRRARAELAARALFVDKGVHYTRDRSGILLYVSLLERTAVLVADRGIHEALPAALWQRQVASIEATVAAGGDAARLAAALAPLSAALATHLPVRDDDINELPDEVDHS